MYAIRRAHSAVGPIVRCESFLTFMNREFSIHPFRKNKYMTFDPKSNAVSPVVANTATQQQNHAKAAEHHDAASVAHKEAAKQATSGDAKSAGYHAAVAQGHTLQANEHSENAIKKTANATPAVK